MRSTIKDARFSGWLRAAVLAIVAGSALLASNLTAGAQAAPKPQHVFIIVLENEGFDRTFGPYSPALYLKQLAANAGLLTNYYGVGHNSLDNYIAMISGQAPNPLTQQDCPNYNDFQQTGTAPDGQAIGTGCIFPKGVSTLVNQLEATRRLTWKGYMEDMGNLADRENSTCGQPKLDQNGKDKTQTAAPGDQYAAKHNPFVYFRSIVGDGSVDADADCRAHVVNLSQLANDLLREETTPNYAFITPNLCHDGHNSPCQKGHLRGGLVAADDFLKALVPAILDSAAYQHDGLLIITFDEADLDYVVDPATGNWVLNGGDASRCCNEQPAPNIKGDVTISGRRDEGPGIIGPGGGRIGAVLISPFIRPGSVSTVEYNHYSMLRSIEDFFGLEHLGYAAQPGLKSFGKDIFNKPR
jgi:phosphatidylinositol-3-phosphatase